MATITFDLNGVTGFTETAIHVNTIPSLKFLVASLQNETIAQIKLQDLEAKILLDCTLCFNLGRVLKESGGIEIGLRGVTLSESDKALLTFLLAGANLNQIKEEAGTIVLKKCTPKTLQLNPKKIKSLNDVFGEYDFMTQTIKQVEKKNPFQQVEASAGETIDEDSLIVGEMQVKQIESCATKAKACKNCQCGRKEAEYIMQSKEELIDQLQKGQIKTSCGSCYLGDAFRCANCPYRGLPAFKQGDKVSVNNVDEKQLQQESGIAMLQDGKVKLQL